jgi:hypothetical protein
MRRYLRTKTAIAAAVIGWLLLVVYWLPRVPLPAEIVWGEAVVVPADGCVYRVSRSGQVHRVGSRWWFVTSPDRCFDTRAEAQRYAAQK